MNLRAALAAALALAGVGLTAAGCGGGTSVSGTINKKSFEALEAISGTVTQDEMSMGAVLISTELETCDIFADAALHKNMKLLQIGLAQFDFGSNKVVAPKDSGEFQVFNLEGGETPLTTKLALVFYFEVDENCVPATQPILGKSGKITLDSADDGAYSGSGDVTLDTGEHITFEFDATACSALSTLTVGGSTGTPSCK
jgi:hypothetical protein